MVTEDFCLQRAYVLFRTMGLRHMPVLSRYHTVVGLITRKELMGCVARVTREVSSASHHTPALCHSTLLLGR